MKHKSIGINALLNGFCGLTKIIFPLITFPYISRILGVENVGLYNFSTSLVNYFSLIAALGITTYAVREGAHYKNYIDDFSSEVFSINVCSTIFSYILLIVLLNINTKLYESRFLTLLLSAKIFFDLIGIEWVYIIYEDFFYITLRTLLIQTVSIIMIFLFVRTERDIYIYAFISVATASISGIFNWFHAKKYGNLRFVLKKSMKKHIVSILIIFFTTITVSVYSTSDITILGFLCGNYTVGLYSVSAKIYNIVKSTLASVIIVSVPKIAELCGNKNQVELEKILTKIYKILISVTFPAIIGIIFLRKDIILLVSGKEYMGASVSLALLAIAMIFNVCAWFWGQCVLIPFGHEKSALNSAIITVIVNIALNFLLIPAWGLNAAAITTIVAEFISLILQKRTGEKLIAITGISMIFFKTLIGSVFMGGVLLSISYYIENIFLRIILSVFAGAAVYLGVESVLKNKELIDEAKKLIQERLHI